MTHHAKHDLILYDELDVSKEQSSDISAFIEDRYLKITPWPDILPVLEVTTYPDTNQQNIVTANEQKIGRTTTLAPASKDSEPAKVINIFISYVKDDEKYKKEILEHLEAMRNQYRKRNYKIMIWHSGDVIPGQDWKKKIEDHLAQAHIILLLVSIKFINSQLCRAIQIQPALKRHEDGEAWVIPVILSPCDWTDEVFGHLEPLPSGERTIVEWRLRAKAYVDVIKGIRRAIEHLT
ncbi:MAG TPA: toll/interleukin-1 receptor domain-containing protein [Ktedonobacteraceae bacterium]|nr:toll/interleukin-1 receptor domain-containing protein [Ktedonobacteraceae bacterium]